MNVIGALASLHRQREFVEEVRLASIEFPYDLKIRLFLEQARKNEAAQLMRWAKAHDPRFQTERTTT